MNNVEQLHMHGHRWFWYEENHYVYIALAGVFDPQTGKLKFISYNLSNFRFGGFSEPLDGITSVHVEEFISRHFKHIGR